MQVCLVHKKTRKRKTLLYSKFIMSIKLGRLLSKDEEVDHKDDYKSNDSIDNLRIVTRGENKNKFFKTLKKTIVELTCPECGNNFTREKRQTHLTKGGTRTFCSRDCVNKNMMVK
jgi:predicted nucleic-acid-binding Zn-ribbon protein